MINVTKTFLPPQEEYNAILKQAWDSHWLTNRGVLVQELEAKLKTYLGVSNVLATANGTLPLQIAIKALGLTGEIITTPFSYVATTSSIVWEGCTPIFVDVHPEYLTIDDTKIEAAITSKTSAILATHVFGNPCDVEAIEAIAKKHHLKVIYDAAHCFGVTYKGQSIFNYGDVSTCSFHATKLFHTGEGGALFCKDEQLYNTFFYHHNFGHKGKEDFQGLGINAKMSELQAAMGLAVLPYMESVLEGRRQAVTYYNSALKGDFIKTLKLRDCTQWNYSYYPVIFNNETQLLKVVKSALEKNNIYSRRYFYPALNNLPYLKETSCPVSESISRKILCLPLYDSLLLDEVDEICKLIKKSL
ncbi:DegT/DnrJ/EryC1/StrS family aminotransferase [Flavobacteriaceae bacterium XHP0103]|uniref:DegT/DnrJ/EryC1/StrS family aminotransferase n=1 Tax=Marixanthotalea marina TaxID=2844359 RepID=UPI00298A0285|nr:DegT/DnrJ/EryC1/StrS family aminotransferase [Marixanthotalea marina]MBU3822753.1 DegT/DnrJ/EryC1/StrS family aminotransferase [Marixanthotalea marina]